MTLPQLSVPSKTVFLVFAFVWPSAIAPTKCTASLPSLAGPTRRHVGMSSRDTLQTRVAKMVLCTTIRAHQQGPQEKKYPAANSTTDFTNHPVRLHQFDTSLGPLCQKRAASSLRIQKPSSATLLCSNPTASLPSTMIDHFLCRQATRHLHPPFSPFPSFLALLFHHSCTIDKIRSHFILLVSPFSIFCFA